MRQFNHAGGKKHGHASIKLVFISGKQLLVTNIPNNYQTNLQVGTQVQISHYVFLIGVSFYR